MSNRSSPCRGDDEELDLALEFQGLRITVRGNADRAASFVQRLAGSPDHRGVPAPSDLGTGQHNPQRPAVSSAPSVASWQEVEPTIRRLGGRQGIALRLRSRLALGIFVCLPLLCLLQQVVGPQSNDCRALGKQGSGLEQCERAEFRAPIVHRPLTPATASTQWSVVRASHRQGYSRLPMSSLVQLDHWRDLTPSATASHRRLRRRPTWLGRATPTCVEMVVEEEELPPLHSDFGVAMFQPYVLDLEALGFGSSGVSQCLAFIVLSRKEGMLLALPELAVPGEALARGDTADFASLVGPHLKMEFGAAQLDEVSVLLEPALIAGRSVQAELVDFNLEVLHALRPLEDPGEVVIPGPDALVARALEWARGDLEEVGERIQFYSADEVPLTPVAVPGANTPPGERAKPARATTPRRPTAPRGGGGKGGSPASPQKKRPTVATLAHSLEEIRQNCSNGGHYSSGLRQIVCLEKAHWRLDYEWIRRSLQLEGLGCCDATSEVFCNLEAKSDLHSAGYRRDACRDARFIELERHGQSNVGSVSSPYSLGLTDSQRVLRSLSRPGVLQCIPFKQGLDGSGEATSRAGSAQRHLFQQCLAEHGSSFGRWPCVSITCRRKTSWQQRMLSVCSSYAWSRRPWTTGRWRWACC